MKASKKSPKKDINHCPRCNSVNTWNLGDDYDPKSRVISALWQCHDCLTYYTIDTPDDKNVSSHTSIHPDNLT